ncbi:MAG: tetratricopeptide repeat protein [Planctomycetaceae bacterium]|nr:tetratricopeptide repeat protein [Planctomycetaceae bacterium]
MSPHRVRNAAGRRLLGAILCLAPAVSGCQTLLNAIPIHRPDESQARTIKGSAQLDEAMQDYQSGHLQAALDATQRARDSDPKLTSAYELEAMLQSDLGNEAEHIATLRQLVAGNPKDPLVQSTAGKLLLNAGQREDGLAAMQRAVQLAPRQTDYARDLAGVYLQAGDLTTAAAVLSAAQIQNPGDQSLPIALARLYETAGDWQRAAEHYRLVLQHDPQNAAWRRQHAKCAYRLEKFALAAADFQRCQETDLSVLTAADRIEFGDACLRTGDLDRAKWLFDQLAAEGCDSREVTVLRGVCALRSDNPALAEQIFAQAVDRWPGDPSLELLLNNSRQARSSVVPAAAIVPAAAEMEWMPPISQSGR